MKLKTFLNFRKLKYKTKNYLGVVVAIVSIIYFAGAISLNEIQSHQVEILEKSPVYPYENYDYMTTEEMYFNIDGVNQELPSFFRTDFASIPKVLWVFDAPYKASFIYPAIWHDYMYTCSTDKTRKQIDDVFFWLLRYEQNSMWQSIKMYLAVRMFGSSYFNNPGSCSVMRVQLETGKTKYEKENDHHG